MLSLFIAILSTTKSIAFEISIIHALNFPVSLISQGVLDKFIYSFIFEVLAHCTILIVFCILFYIYLSKASTLSLNLYHFLEVSSNLNQDSSIIKNFCWIFLGLNS